MTITPAGTISLQEAHGTYCEYYNQHKDVVDFVLASGNHEPASHTPLVLALQSGKLEAKFTSTKDGREMRLSPDSWNRFYPEQPILFGKFGDAHNRETFEQVPYVNKSDFQAWFEVSQVTTYPFAHEAEWWSLAAALVWLKTGGTGILDDLDFDQAAERLFPALLQQANGLEATALPESKVRESIPAGYWECAVLKDFEEMLFHLDATVHEQHLVSSIGTFRPVGYGDDRWEQILISKGPLVETFPLGQSVETNVAEAEHNSIEVRRSSKSYPDIEVARWFTEDLKQPFLDDMADRLTRDEVEELARIRFPDISTTQVREMYSQNAPPFWRVRGGFKRHFGTFGILKRKYEKD